MCDRKGCPNEGEWNPVLVLRTDPMSTASAKAVLQLRVCNECRDVMNPADFISDAGWAQILDSFQRLRLIPPSRELTTLQWIH